MKKCSQDSKQKNIDRKAEMDKKVDKIPKELESLMIDTSKSSEKRSSTEILNELRNGVK